MNRSRDRRGGKVVTNKGEARAIIAMDCRRKCPTLFELLRNGSDFDPFTCYSSERTVDGAERRRGA